MNKDKGKIYNFLKAFNGKTYIYLYKKDIQQNNHLRSV